MKKNNNLNIGFITSSLLILWIVIGLFFGNYRALITTELATKNLILSAMNTPASPVVLESYYNEKKWELSVSLVNTGIMPIRILDKSLLLTPKWAENIVIWLDVPMNAVLNGWEILTVRTILTPENKDKFKLGDTLVSKFNYTYPVSNDIYSLTHIFVKSDVLNKNNNIVNKNWDNINLQNQYRKQTEQNYNKQK